MSRRGTTTRFDGLALPGRIRGRLVVLMVLLGYGAIAAARGLPDDSVASLAARVADVATPWAERCAAEDALVAKPFRDVLPALLPHLGSGMPPGGIWNSGGREGDEQAPAAWQAFHAVARVWDGQISKVSRSGQGAILGEILAKAETPTAKEKILHDIGRRPWPELEPAVAALLKDEREPVGVRAAAARALVLQGQDDYHAFLLAAFEQEKAHASRVTWFRILVDPRHKQRSGVDPLVVIRGFDLVEAERAASPGYIHGAYFLVLAIGGYVDQDFMPPKHGPRYVTATRLSEAFFSDTVENALRWWKEHRDDYAK